VGTDSDSDTMDDEMLNSLSIAYVSANSEMNSSKAFGFDTQRGSLGNLLHARYGTLTVGKICLLCFVNLCIVDSCFQCHLSPSYVSDSMLSLNVLMTVHNAEYKESDRG
jgi:hypothetical protein